MIKLCTLAAAALWVGMLTPAVATNTSGTCQTAKAKFVGSNTLRSTSSDTFVNLGGTAVNFTQGGVSNSCVIVYFSGAVGTVASTYMYLRATLDGAASAVPSDTLFIYDLTAPQTHAVSFIFPSVAPGAHTARIQYRSGTGGNTVSVYTSNTIVHYAP